MYAGHEGEIIDNIVSITMSDMLYDVNVRCHDRMMQTLQCHDQIVYCRSINLAKVPTIQGSYTF